MELTGKTVVVTGASAGIGEAIAVELSGAGCNLVITGRRQERLDALAAKLAGPSAVLAADVADAQTPERLLALAVEKFGRADAVINNAGVLARGSVDDIDLDAVSYMIRVNFEAVVRSSYVFARAFKAQGSGSIINISSIGAYLATSRAGAYGGLKHALEVFTASLRVELIGTGVKVGTLAPGSTETEMFATMTAGMAQPPAALKSEDIAAAVRFMLQQPDRANIARLAMFSPTDPA